MNPLKQAQRDAMRARKALAAAVAASGDAAATRAYARAARRERGMRAHYKDALYLSEMAELAEA
jgi:hypothetical protein